MSGPLLPPLLRRVGFFILTYAGEGVRRCWCVLLCVRVGLGVVFIRVFRPYAAATYPRSRPLFYVVVHDVIETLPRRLTLPPFVRCVEHERRRAYLP